MAYLKPESEAKQTAGGSMSSRTELPRPRMKWVKAGLSLFIVFHLFCVLLVPNSDNATGEFFLRFTKPYLFFFEMTNTWNFFAPNPEPPIWIDYQLLDAQGQPYFNGRWPDIQKPYFLRERQTRLITAADFMVNNEVSAEKMMVNYLCHLQPHPDSLRLWRIMETVPTSADVASGRRTIGDGVGEDRKFVSHDFCSDVGIK
jgi:hypothetical protein